MISDDRLSEGTSGNECWRTCNRWRKLFWQAVVGFLFGYLVLHPVSMVIFQWLDPRLAATMPYAMASAVSGGWFAPIAHSFHLSMLSMGLVFGMIGALISTSYAYHRSLVAAQRDRLAEQAEVLKQNNVELARLELANRRTSQFMAHDFKTALGCVAGHATQLMEQPQLQENGDVLNTLLRIRRQAHGMMGSVADLLEFARVRERSDRQRQAISVTELLQEAVSDFSLPMHVEQITLGANHPCCPPVLADARQLRRVLCNLISNAIKHNGPGARVWLDAEVDESRGEALISCRDDGAGVSPEVLPGIFAEFASTGESSSESTGLGLAFCKTVVEAHRGRIWCENSQQGAQFLFTIPFAEGA